MNKSQPLKLPSSIIVNGNEITHVVVGRHYKEKHSSYMTDKLVLELVQMLNGNDFNADSTSKGIEYYAVDIHFSEPNEKVKLYRLVWLFEGTFLEIIGVINAYRVKKLKK